MRHTQTLYTISGESIPRNLREMSRPPEQLHIWGDQPPLSPTTKYLTVVGSRKFTNYGASVVASLITELRGYNITIVSGLALGIDALALEAALAVELRTIAVPGSGLHLSVLHPKTNYNLAHRIVASGGCLLSEFDTHQVATKWTFPARNRLMAGIADAVLVIEAQIKSGTHITAGLAANFGRTVMAVPGSIFNSQSEGTNHLISEGATPVLCAQDIVEGLGLTVINSLSATTQNIFSVQEQLIIDLLSQPLQCSDLVRRTELPHHEATTLLSRMELSGYIYERGGYIYRK